MNTQGHERRKFVRIFFQSDEKVMSTVVFPNEDNKKVTAGVLNLSEEGVCLVLERRFLKENKTVKIYKGDRLLLNDIVGITPEIKISEQELKVKWVIDNLYFNHMEIGCHMLNVSERVRDGIQQVISSREE
jgi:predicted RNA binding protein with dsRBD fold (UPF0201 family)